MTSRCPEYHCQNEIGCRSGNQQHFRIHIRVEDPVAHRDPASRQKSQCQHTARHSAGHGKQQQHQAQQFFLSAESRQGQQHTHRHFGGKCSQKSKPWQKYRYRIGSAQKSGEQIPPPFQRYAGQPGCHKKEHVVHSPVQHKHAVHVYYRHPVSPFRFTGSIIGQPICKYRRKKEMDGRSRPSVFPDLFIRKVRSWMPPEPKS